MCEVRVKRTHELRRHPLRQLVQLLRARRQWRSAQRARLRHALRPELHYTPRTERVAARERGGVARPFEADQTTMSLDRLLAQPLLLRLDSVGEHVGLARLLMAAVPPVLLW